MPAFAISKGWVELLVLKKQLPCWDEATHWNSVDRIPSTNRMVSYLRVTCLIKISWSRAWQAVRTSARRIWFLVLQDWQCCLNIADIGRLLKRKKSRKQNKMVTGVCNEMTGSSSTRLFKQAEQQTTQARQSYVRTVFIFANLSALSRIQKQFLVVICFVPFL